MKRAHLSDDRLIEISLADPLAPIDEPHLRNCERCEHRRLVLASTLGDVSERVMGEVDAAFPAERLARQHARIMQQLDHLGRPARVIAFPVGRTQEPARPAVSGRRTRRWVAATGAIAVAFLVGIFQTQDELSPGLAGKQIIIERCSRASQMEWVSGFCT